jgi:trehalose 6-phosphate synthase
MSRIVVVSNRVPLPTIDPRAGGLAVVLSEMLACRGGLWFGWSGRISERSRPPTLVRDGRVRYATTDLSPAEHQGYYSGHCNRVLWPALHAMPESVRFSRDDAMMYRHVNKRMALLLFPLLRSDDLIWVHDYHLFALPAELRRCGVRCRIGFFLHTPFPAADVMRCVPGLEQLLSGVLNADLIGFQTTRDISNFLATAVEIGGACAIACDRLQFADRIVRIGVFPAEIEPISFAATAARAANSAAAVQLMESLHGQLLVLGVDRLDPTKGLVERLRAFGRLLETRSEWRGRVTLLQIAAESRASIPAYKALRQQLEQLTGRINARLGQPHWTPIRLITIPQPRDLVAGYMRLARVALVTSRRDGMNLVAKEFIAAQDPEGAGVLILSRFAGAAEQLCDALLVNPLDQEDIMDALAAALEMAPEVRTTRWRHLWNKIERRSTRGWGTDFLAALAGPADGANEGVADDWEDIDGAFADLPALRHVEAEAIVNLSASRAIASMPTKLRA